LEDWKIKISVLWLFLTVAWLIVMTFMFFAPGMIDQIRAGKIHGEQITGEFLLISAIFLLVPLVMAILSLTLKDKINRWANIIVGIVFSVLRIYCLIEALKLDLSIFAYELLMDISMVVATALIVWYAWKSKQKA